MKSVTQKARYRQAIIKYAEKYGVKKAANRYNVNRQYIYRWKNRYDGTLDSLADKSHRPHSHPNQHTEQELKLISDMRRRNPNAGLVVFWVKLRQRGYTRSITGLYRVLIRMGLKKEKLPNPKYIPKPYEQMQYPGQRVQIDVKFVPNSCLVSDAKGEKFYQYTAIDEYSRFRYLEAFNEHSTYSSAVFLERLAKTENPTPTLFESRLKQHGIKHKLIKPYTPRHNGKVERSHRKDNEYFYASHKFYSFDDFKKQLAVHSRKYNNFPMRPLNWRSPAEYVKAFIQYGEVF